MLLLIPMITVDSPGSSWDTGSSAAVRIFRPSAQQRPEAAITESAWLMPGSIST